MKKLLAMLLVLCLMVGMMPAALAAGSYVDVPTNEWYADEVAYVTEKGLMDGIDDGKFGPDVDVSRAMVVTILHRVEGEPTAAASPFADVPANEWYTKAVAWAAANGIVEGVSDTRFAPTEDITREQLAAILYRYADYKGYDVSARANLGAYADAGKISTWALAPMQWAVAVGLIDGVTETALQPAGTANRAQLAAIIYRFCTKVSVGAGEDKDDTYTVTFMLNYGTAAEYTSVEVEAGAKVAAPANPTRSGYSFRAWCTDTAGNSRYNFNAPVESDLTLYASWNKQSTGGGSIGHTHRWVEDEDARVEPTCGTDGTASYTCSSCGQDKTEVLTATGEHTWDGGEVTTDPTCTATGIETITCTTCHTQKTETIKANGHTWGDNYTDTANAGHCTAATLHQCSKCQTVEQVAEGNTHNLSNWTEIGDVNHKRQCTNSVGQATCTYTETAPHDYGAWSYEGTTGTRTCSTCDHSQDKTFEARIGTAYYGTLAESIAAADAGAEITLLGELSYTSEIVVDKAITLNGAGNTITSTSSAAGILVTAAATITDLTVSGHNATQSAWDNGQYGIKVYNATGVTLDDVTVTAANAGIQINGSAVTLTGTVTVSGNEFGGIEVCKGAATGAGALTIATGAEVVCADTTVPAIWIDKYTTDGCTVTGADAFYSLFYNQDDKDQLWYSTQKDAIEAVAVANIGNAYYLTLADAVAYADGKTITVFKDISSGTVKIDNPVAVTITEAEGKEITLTDVVIAIGSSSNSKRMDVTLKGITFAGKSVVTIGKANQNAVYDTLNPTAISIVNCVADTTSNDSAPNKSKAPFVDLGSNYNFLIDLTLEGNTITTNNGGADDASPVVYGHSTIINKAVIKNNTFGSESNAVERYAVKLGSRVEGTEITFDGNTVYGATTAAKDFFLLDLWQSGDKNIERDNLTVTLKNNKIIGTPNTERKMYVAYIEATVKGDNLSISATGNTISDAADNSIKSGFVASIGSAYYYTLEAAIAAAAEGDTITLMSDAEITAAVEAQVNITITGEFDITGLDNLTAAEGKTVTIESKPLAFVISDTERYYVVADKEDMVAFAKQVNDRVTTYEGETVKLVADIDLKDVAWTPIGNVDSFPGKTFAGTFDGNGKTISNMTTVDKTENNATAGFFGSINGAVKNLTLKNVNVTSSHYAGAVVGYAYGTITNCKVEGGTITSTPEKLGEKYDNGDKVGGIVGYVGEGSSSVTDNTVTDITVKGYRDVGGIAGYAYGTITGNTGSGVTIQCDNNHNYKNYTTFDEYDLNLVLGDNESITTIDNNTIKGSIEIAEGFSYVVNADEEYYAISNAAGLVAFEKSVNTEKVTYSGKTVKLTADIDLEKKEWTPITQTGGTAFTGTFDGNGFTIKNLSVDSTDKTDETLYKNYSTGLFGFIEGGATIKNVKIDGATMKGHHNVAVIAGYISNSVTITGCEVKNANLTNTHIGNDLCGDKTGVIAGNIQGSGCSITECSAIKCTVKGGRDAGQLVGANTVSATVSGTATEVTVSATEGCTGINIRNELVGRVS